MGAATAIVSLGGGGGTPLPSNICTFDITTKRAVPAFTMNESLKGTFAASTKSVTTAGFTVTNKNNGSFSATLKKVTTAGFTVTNKNSCTFSATLKKATPAFTMAAEVVYPTITGNTLRLRADLGITTETGGRVITWVDQKSVLNNFTAVSASSARPTQITNNINGRPIIRFDGTANKLLTTSALSALITSTAFTIYGVLRQNSAVANSGTGQYLEPAIIGDNPSGGFWWNTATTTQVHTGFFHTTEKHVSLNQAASSTTLFLFQAKLSSSTLSLKLGSLGTPTTVATGGAVDNVSNTLALGISYSSGAAFLRMDLCELLGFNIATTTQNDTDIEAYLNYTWGPGL